MTNSKNVHYDRFQSRPANPEYERFQSRPTQPRPVMVNNDPPQPNSQVHVNIPEQPQCIKQCSCWMYLLKLYGILLILFFLFGMIYTAYDLLRFVRM